ncbi:hypothetical protein GCM10009662_69660 [Catellatospora coxensis]|uniref:Major royal jelly protein n=1 Tax=Catellatospora coxensis TaxID=310354 RepID=A0A8J3L0Y6_9ACTN|nr:hypothetical protein Cco03nite_59240 [Catellatospora coxensis]
MTRVVIIAAAVLATAVALLSATEPDNRPWPGKPDPAAVGLADPAAPGETAVSPAAQTAAPAAPYGRFAMPGMAAKAGQPIAIHTADLPANEASGLVASRRHAGVFYWLRDGGGATTQRPRAALWTIRLGEDAQSHPVRRGENFPFAQVFEAPNADWEDVVIDDDDNLWIGDIGANDCVSRQYLYRTLEPDPDTDDPFMVTAKYPLAFPDPAPGCKTRNAEAMLWLDGELYLFAKTANSPVYRAVLPAERNTPVTLLPVAKFDYNVNKISVSTVSDDRTRLTLAGHARYWVFAADPELTGDEFLRKAMSGKPVHTATFESAAGNASVEGGSYVPGTHDLLFVAENKEIFLVPDGSVPTRTRR